MSDTAAIRPEERFDEAKVSGYLDRHLDGLSGPWTFEQFPGGKANLTYLARSGDGCEVVLRRPPLGPIAPKSHDMAREYRVLSRLATVFSKAPMAYALCEDPSVMGAPFFVMERRRGHVVRETWPQPLSSRDARLLVANSLVNTLVDLHAIDFEAIGLGDLGRPRGFAERQVTGWRSRWELAKSGDVLAMDELIDRLEGSIPAEMHPVVLHNDFKLDNTMLNDRGEVTAVFDWDMATLGDPRFDVGTMLAYWVDPSDAVFPLLAGTSSVLSDVMSRSEVRAAYSSTPLPDLNWFEAFATFRIAVIIQQIAIRYIRGQTSDSRFAGLDQMVGPIASQAIDRLAPS